MMPDSLVSRLFKAKYFRHNFFLNASKGHCASFTWQSLLWGRNFLKRGLLWRVGNGQSISTVHSYWIPSWRFIPYKGNVQPLDPSVSYFIDDNGCWSKDRLLEFFDHELVLVILVVPIGDPSLQDSFIWEHHPFGSFTVNFASHLAKFSTSLPASSDNHSLVRWWKVLWNLKIPQKIKHFIWRAFYHNLSVALYLFHRKVLTSPLCSLYSGNAEFVSHAFIECSRASFEWSDSIFESFY
uniref:Reverse transcriptase zinc-binding domain-containing protein n=1 Tax=Cannabis sativa TaxID=3483 RepID=A0A803PZ32_CANSA